MSTQRTGRIEIAHRLRRLASDMEEIAALMDYYGGLPEWARHGAEMACAAGIARNWSDAIEDEQQEQTCNTKSALPG